MRLNWDAVITSASELLEHDKALMTRTFSDGKLTLLSVSTATSCATTTAGGAAPCPGPCVYAGFEFAGTMSSPFPSGEGVPTQRPAKTCGMAVFTLDGAGRIVEVRNYVNQYALLVTAGVIPALSSSSSSLNLAPSSGAKQSQQTGQPQTTSGSTTGTTTTTGGAMEQQARGL